MEGLNEFLVLFGQIILELPKPFDLAGKSVQLKGKFQFVESSEQSVPHEIFFR